MVIQLHVAADRGSGSGKCLVDLDIVFADRVEGSAAHIGLHFCSLRDRVDGETGFRDDRMETDVVIVGKGLAECIDGV